MVMFGPVPAQASNDHTNWAILISGGWNTASNNARYWNDIGEMYEILTDTYDYTADHIFVLYADGNPPTAANCPDPEHVYGYPTNVIDFAATLTNLDTVTDTIAASSSPWDTLFVFTNDHGAADGSLYLWGETISPATFAGSGYIGDISQYTWRAFVMKQCYSGAFVAPLSGPRTLIATACRADEQAHGGLDHPRYGEFSFYFSAALKGAEPDIVGGTPVDADVNNDGRVSFVEAFNYAQSHDERPEHPQYDDNGDGISHEGQMPAGGDGSQGSFVFIGVDSGVTGIVRDAATGNPLPNSTVTVKQSLHVVQEQKTNSDGRYAIALPPGIYFVWASHTGYYDLGQAVGVSAGVYTTRDFGLTKSTGGGGCPFLYVWDGNDYVDEGPLDIHNAEGVDVTYEHVLMTVPEPVNGAYKFRLVEHPKTISHIDRVQLRVVLEDGTVEEFPLISAQHSEDGNAINLLLKSDDNRVEEKGADLNGGVSQSIGLKFAALGPHGEAVAFIFTIEGYNMICKTCV
jgi:hypothetical protein